MKLFIQRFLAFLKSLFLKLRVIVTLQLGKDKVDRKYGSNPVDENDKMEKGNDYETK